MGNLQGKPYGPVESYSLIASEFPGVFVEKDFHSTHIGVLQIWLQAARLSLVRKEKMLFRVIGMAQNGTKEEVGKYLSTLETEEHKSLGDYETFTARNRAKLGSILAG